MEIVKNRTGVNHFYPFIMILGSIIFWCDTSDHLMKVFITIILCMLGYLMLKKQEVIMNPDYHGELSDPPLLSRSRAFIAAACMMGGIVTGIVTDIFMISYPDDIIYPFVIFGVVMFTTALFFVFYLKEITRACLLCEVGIIAFLLAFAIDSIVKFACHG